MALFDFLGNDIGGYSGAVHAPATGMTGITWGDIAQAALRYGSKPGSSGSALADLVPGTSAAQKADAARAAGLTRVQNPGVQVPEIPPAATAANTGWIAPAMGVNTAAQDANLRMQQQMAQPRQSSDSAILSGLASKFFL